MEENLQPEIISGNQLLKVTPLSKYLAMILFIAMPFIGGYIGYVYAPVKIIEVEKQVTSDSHLKENSSTPTSAKPPISSSDKELFKVWDTYRESGAILVNGDPVATIERDFPSSNAIVYQTDDKLKTFFQVDDSRYYYSPCTPLYYLDLNELRYHNFQKDYCPTDGMGIGVRNAQAALPLVFQYGKMENDLHALNLETEQETQLFSADSLASDESLISGCVEGNYDFQEITDMEVIGKSLRIGVYKKRQIAGSCTKEEYYEKLRDVSIAY